MRANSSRFLVSALAVILAVPALAGWQESAHAQPTDGATSPGQGPPKPQSETPAEIAKRTGKRVEVASLRTETTQVFANPSGTRTMESYALPVRARRGDAWVDIDTRLGRHLDGSVRPKAAVADIRLSGGGDANLVSLRRGNATLRLGWKRTLPAPVLDGDTATYPDVLPDVDLRVRVEADGFAQVLVVKNRKAARDPALRSLRYPVKTTGLSLKTSRDGITVASDAEGAPVFVAGAPMMWDTAPRPATPAEADARAAHGGPPERPGSRLPARLGDGELTITPDQKMLTADDTNFPVYIDPDFSGGQYRWTHVNEYYPNQSYWSYDRGQGAKVGYSNWSSPTVMYRSFLQMGTKTLNGTKIIRSHFAITLDHSASCTATTVDLWNTKPIDPATALTWNNSGGHWYIKRASKAGHANESSCPKSDMLMEFASSSLTNLVQYIADIKRGYLNLGLRAPDERNKYQWKRFHPGTAKIIVEYNTPPGQPTDLNTAYPMQCGSASSPTPISNTEPQFSAKAYDPDGDNLTTKLRIFRSDGTLAHSVDSSTTTSGAAFSWPAVPAGKLVNGGAYYYRAQSSDGKHSGPATGNCHFTIDTDRPGVPRIESADYPDGGPLLDTYTTGTVTFRPAAGETDQVAEYLYGFDQDRVTMRVRARSDGTAVVPITLWADPVTGIPDRRLYAKAVDRAGNVSGITRAWDLAAFDNFDPPEPARGDLNADGLADVTAVVDHGFGRTAVWNFTAHDGGFHAGTVGWDSGVNGGFALYKTRAVRGDFDGDGGADVALFREEPGRVVSLYLLESDGNRYTSPAAPLWSSGSATWPLTSARMSTGDADGDGKSDIAVQIDSGSDNWRVLVFRGGNLGTPSQWIQTASGSGAQAFSAPMLADIDGDGDADLVDVRDAGGCRLITEMYRSSGAGFSSSPVTLRDSGAGNWCWSRSKQVVADVDGDGRDDIVSMYDYGGTDTGLWVYRSTGTALDPSLWWRRSNEFDAIRATLSTGDFDNDGREDLAVFYDCCSLGERGLWTLRSTGTSYADKVLGWRDAIGASTGPLAEIQHRSYELVARHSGKCLAVAGGNTDDGAIMHQWTCGNRLQLRYQLARVPGTKWFAMKPAHTVKCTDVSGHSLSQGAAVVQWGCTGDANQQITLEYAGSGGYDRYVRLRFGHSGKCAAIESGSTDNGADLVQENCSGAANQQWLLRTAVNPQLDGVYKISSAKGGKVLSVRDCQTINGADVRMWDWVGGACQKWTLKSVGDDVYQVFNGHAGKNLDIEGCSAANAATVHLWSPSSSICQLWRIEPAADGTHSIFAINSGKSLDVGGCSPNAGAEVIIWPYWGGGCQRWTLQKL